VVDRSADIPNAQIAPPEELTCVKRRIMLDATGSDRGNNFVVSWTASNGGIIVNGVNTYTPEIEGTGTYTMTLENTDNNCEVNRSVDVTEDVTLPDANIAPEGTLDCLTDQIDLSAQGSSQGSNFTYEWSTSDGLILSGNVNQFRITIGEEGTYTVTVTNLTNGCINTADIEVVEVGNTFVSLDLEGRNPRCHGETNGYVGVANLVGGMEPFQYTIDGVTYGSNSQFPNLPPGTYTITVLDAAGCEISETVTIIDPDPFEIELGDNLIVEIGESVDWEAVFQARINRNDIVSIVWTKDGVVVSTIDTVRATDAGTYVVTVTDVNGCQASDAINLIVKIKRRVFVPNAFTPNDDGNNDGITVFGDDLVKIVNKFEIYDRWGELVWVRENFAPNDPALGWDGKLKGKDMMPAVFVYKTTVEFFDGVQETYYGDFTLIR
jgi:gliding motility-associated-like protein